MLKFSKATVGAIFAVMAVFSAHGNASEIVGSIAQDVSGQGLAFKRRASLSHEFREHFHKFGNSLLSGSFEAPKARLVSSGSNTNTVADTQSNTQPQKNVRAASDKDAAPQALISGQNFSQTTSFWQSSSNQKGSANQEKMKVYSDPSKKSNVLAQVSSAQNFSVEQGDWVRIKTSEGVVGWALVKDVEQNITNAWHDEYQVIMNGQSSNYSVTKISAEERKKRQKAMMERQNQRLKRLSALWEQDFFDYDDVDGKQDEIKHLKDQVMALNDQIKSLQSTKKDVT